VVFIAFGFDALELSIIYSWFLIVNVLAFFGIYERLLCQRNRPFSGLTMKMTIHNRQRIPQNNYALERNKAVQNRKDRLIVS
jgi:hypothetical protein